MIPILLSMFSLILLCAGFFACSQFDTIFVVLGICLGVLSIPFSYCLIKKPNLTKTSAALAVLTLIWGGICLFSLVVGVLIHYKERMETAYIRLFNPPWYLAVFYKDYYRYENNGIIKIEENWREILENKYREIEEGDYVVSDMRTSYWAVNRKLNEKSIWDIDINVILFAEMDTITKPVIDKEDFMSQDWNEITRRRIVLFDGRVYEYCYSEDKYYSASEDNRTIHIQLKWE